MYRQSSSRNQRSKGIKVKNALQIGLLIAVCFWLIYQVKHSHDKKKEFDESDPKASLDGEISGGFIKLGRKDIHPRVEGTLTEDKYDEAEENEATEEEVEENKQEEERPEDKKVEEEDDEGLRDGDDETDEHELEKLDTEVDQEEDFVDDEKEREAGAENETEGKNSDDVNDQMEKGSFVEHADRDGDDSSTHEARKELYKADDASIAVTHDTETTENENKSEENSNEHPEIILQQGNEENNEKETNNGEMRKQLEAEGSDMAKGDNPSNLINGETNVTTKTKENTLETLENGSSPNITLTEVSNDFVEISNNSTEATTQGINITLQNVTESASGLDHDRGIVTDGTSTERSDLQTISLEGANNSTLDREANPIDSNSTGHAEPRDAESNLEEFSNPSNNTESLPLVKITRPEASVEARINSVSAIGKNEATEAEKLDTSDGTDEVLRSAITGNPEKVRIDSVGLSDSSHSSEEKFVPANIDTLPEIQIEGTNNEDVVAE